MEAAVAKTVVALIGIQRRAGRHCPRVPDGIAVLNVVIFSVGIYRNVVVAVAGNAQQLGILVEAVAAAGIGNQGKEILGAQVIDPGQRGIRCGDHIFFIRIIEMSEIHGKSSLKVLFLFIRPYRILSVVEC